MINFDGQASDLPMQPVRLGIAQKRTEKFDIQLSSLGMGVEFVQLVIGNFQPSDFGFVCLSRAAPQEFLFSEVDFREAGLQVCYDGVAIDI